MDTSFYPSMYSSVFPFIHIVGTVASKSGFPQVTLVVICGSVLFGLIVITLIFVAGIVLTRRCIRRRKKSSKSSGERKRERILHLIMMIAIIVI